VYFSSGDDDDDYWNSYDEDDEDDFLGEYTSHDHLYADHLLSSMTDKMFINSSSRLKKARGNDFHATYNWISQEEAERNATELIRAEEEEKLKAEKRKLKNKKKREQKKAYKAKKKGKAAKPKDPEPDYSSHSENEEQVANETADANTIDTVTKKDDSFGWDVNSAFVKAASKHTTYVVTTESSNEESTVKTDSQTSSPPNGINVNLHTNTIGVQGRVEEYSEVEIKESRKIAALANRYAASYQFPEAVAKFTEAINMYPLDHRYYGNRSFCYEHLKSFDKALSDAESSLHILPNWPKGHFRRGKALYGLQKYQEAEEAYLKVLDLDSSYDDAKAELATTRLSCLHSLGFSEEQCRRVVNENSIQSAIDSLLGSPSPKSTSSEFVTVNLPSKLPLNSKPERENPITNGEVVSGIDGRCSVWVGNINHDVTERQLKQIFSKCGDVDSLRVLSERHCAFVNYTSPYHATRAIEELQGHYCSGQYLLLKYPDNPRDGPFVPSKKHKVMNDKLQGPVNGDECYFWRTTGCHFGSRCFYKHLPESRGVDLQQHMTKPV
jgi:tetratricopeptide (TPR) repeat protein